MYELRQVGERTYYVDCPARVGIYKISETEVCLIDGGSDKSMGRKLQVILEEQGWTLQAIFNTHSHADHIGGNNLLQTRLGCKIYAPGTEMAFINYPETEASFLFGGLAHKGLRNKFFCAAASVCQPLTPEILPQGLTYELIPGHAGSQAAYCTRDGVWFLGDGVVAEETLEKYHISYIYHIENFLKSLEVIEKLQGNCFIPAHAEPQTDIKNLVAVNRRYTLEVGAVILEICREPLGFDQILKGVFDHFAMVLNPMQHALIGATVRSYLTYFMDTKQVKMEVLDNVMVWARVYDEQ